MKINAITSFFTVIWILVDGNERYPKRLSDRNLDIPIQQYGRYNGGVFTNNVLLGGNLEKPPFTVAVFVEGNGVYDEVQSQTSSGDELDQLVVKNVGGRFAFVLKSRNLAVMCKKSEPASMVVVVNGKCRRRKYDLDDPKLAPTEGNVVEHECAEIVREIKWFVPESNNVNLLSYKPKG